MVTGSSAMPSTQAASHGAGQSRPVNSGKLFVACSAPPPPSQAPVRTRSFQSGMRLPSGQPSWQNGMPQSMHRVAWSRISSSPAGGYTSRQSRMRTGTGPALGQLPLVAQETVRIRHGLDPHDRLVDVRDRRPRRS